MKLWEQSECARTEYLGEACKVHEVNPAVLGSVALVSDLALDLRDIDISCVNDKRGKIDRFALTTATRTRLPRR